MRTSTIICRQVIEHSSSPSFLLSLWMISGNYWPASYFILSSILCQGRDICLFLHLSHVFGCMFQIMCLPDACLLHNLNKKLETHEEIYNADIYASGQGGKPHNYILRVCHRKVWPRGLFFHLQNLWPSRSHGEAPYSSLLETLLILSKAISQLD